MGDENTALPIRSPGLCAAPKPTSVLSVLPPHPLPLSAGQGWALLPPSPLRPLPAPAGPHLSPFPSGNCFHLACPSAPIPWKCGSPAAAHKAARPHPATTATRGEGEGSSGGLSAGTRPRWLLLASGIPRFLPGHSIPFALGLSWTLAWPGSRPERLLKDLLPLCSSEVTQVRRREAWLEGMAGQKWGPAGPHPGNPLLEGHGRGAKQGTGSARDPGTWELWAGEKGDGSFPLVPSN